MSEPFALETVPLFGVSSLALSRQLLANKETLYTIPLADGPLTVAGKWLMVNIFLWRPLLARGMPVQRRHTLHSGLVTKERLAGVFTEIYNDAMQPIRGLSDTQLAAEEKQILYDLCETINDLHTMIATQLGAYHLSISAFELCDLLDHPEVKALTQVNLDDAMHYGGIPAAEAVLKDAGDKLMTVLRDTSIPGNVLGPFIQLGLLSPQQVPQVFQALGFRTDASDLTIRHPITSSYTTGLQTIIEFAIESTSAKKTVYYNKNGMPGAQYSNRKQQLLASTVRHLYRGDCGTPLVVAYDVTEPNVSHLTDKYIVESGGLKLLTRQNVRDYIGKRIQLRSPTVCRHRDGICHICGGRITDFMPTDVVVGIASTIEYASQASSLVLSAKHFSKTNSSNYRVPEQLSQVLMVQQNDIFLRPDLDVSNLMVGVPFQDMQHISDMVARPLRDDDDDDTVVVGEQQFSNITSMLFARISDGVAITQEIPMNSGDVFPYFSTEMRNYIKRNIKSITIGDVIWIPLKKFDLQNEPLLRCIIESNSMMKFNKQLETFATRSIRGYTSIPDALRDFTTLVYEKLSTNIMHLEVVLKSYLIDPLDYTIPLVSDPDDVHFGDLRSIITRRSLGTFLAFERLKEFRSRPEPYVMGHPVGLFDVYFPQI